MGVGEMRDEVPGLLEEVAFTFGEAEDLGDDSAKSNVKYMGGLDMSPVWNIWRDPLGPDTAMGDVYITTTPRFGLAKRD